MSRYDEFMLAPDLVLRDLEPGDLEWVAQQHGQVYSQEYGFNAQLEVFVARMCADFSKNFKPGWERGWIAQHRSERVGSVFVTKKSNHTAMLSMLIVTSQARGLGIGVRLIDEAIRFTRARGYTHLMLWTHTRLLAARALYKSQGFQLIDTEATTSFGQPTISETWQLTL